MAVSVNETEAKFDVPPGAELPRLDDLPGVDRAADQAVEQLEAEYFDTDDLRLLRAGVTLRRRRGGGDAGWHLKIPASAGTRREIRLPLGRSGARVPKDLATLVRAHTRGAALRPVASVTTTRRRVDLLDQSGKSLAEVAADQVSARTLGESTTISHWHEVEVELTGGGPGLLKAAGRRLREAGLTPADHPAKLARALGRPMPEPGQQPGPGEQPGAGQQPDSAQQPRPGLGRSSPAGQVVLAYLGSQVQRLKHLDTAVRNNDPGSIHQMRVTTRRLRSTLRTFAPLLHGTAPGEAAGELKWLGGVLGKARDAEVLAGHLRKHLHQLPVEQNVGPVEARVQGHFAPVGAAARSEVLEALDSSRYFALLDGLDRLAADPPFTDQAARPAAEVLPAEVRRPYRQVRKRMRRARRLPPGRSRDAALHEARKAAKRARYAGEAVSPAFGKKAARFTKRMKKVQSVLGDHQDTVIAREVERELGMSAQLAGENAYTYGLLNAREAQAAEGYQRQAQCAWRKASRPRYRRWLS